MRSDHWTALVRPTVAKMRLSAGLGLHTTLTPQATLSLVELLDDMAETLDEMNRLAAQLTDATS